MIEHALLDAHVHLWDPERFPMPWLESTPDLNRAFDIEAYGEQIAGVSIAGLIYVEVGVAPPFALLEATHAALAEKAQQGPRLVGVVAAAPLEYGEPGRSYLHALHALGPLLTSPHA
jgi:L-fuconolactonase